MNYEIVNLEPVTVAGISTRTGNEKPDVMEKIGKLWQEFMMPGGKCEQMPHKCGDYCYGIYYNYTWDDMCYDVLAAWGVEETAQLPEEYTKVAIPGGQYAKFTFQGNATQDTGQFWTQVWNTPLPRAYSYDFEIYHCQPGNEENAQIEIYVALADICQSCGMPMTEKAHYGTNADGSPSQEYCAYCYENGKFQAECSMEEMIEICLDAAPEMYNDRDSSRKQMLEYFPTLKRWKEK